MTLMDAALRASLVLLIGLVLRAALRGRAPGLRHTVVALAIFVAPAAGGLGLLLPGVAVDVPLPLAGRFADAATAEPPADAGPASVSTDAARLDGVAEAPRSFSWSTAALVAGGSGATLALLLLGAAGWRWRRLAASSGIVTDARWIRALDRARHEAGVSREVRLCVANGAPLATWGWRRPVLLIPSRALDWPDDRIHAVLAHELAHIARHDWLLQTAAEAVRALLWWNPLAWLACDRLRRDAELACDDAVLRAGVRPSAYAEHLVHIARDGYAEAWAHGSAMRMVRRGATSTLERRIVAMLTPGLDRRTPTRLTSLAAGAAVIALLLPVALLRAAQGGRQPLEGVVYDPTGAVLPGAAVTLDVGPAKVETTTDAAGSFSFAAVDPGKHSLQVEVPGFRTLLQPLELKQDADWSRTVMLQVGDLQETISVRVPRPATPIPLASGGPVRVGGNIRAPRKLTSQNPVYPERLRDAGLEGRVRVEAVIGADGRVGSARVVSAPIHPDFAQAALDAVRAWTFEPTLLNGKPIEVVMTVSIDFSLE